MSVMIFIQIVDKENDRKYPITVCHSLSLAIRFSGDLD